MSINPDLNKQIGVFAQSELEKPNEETVPPAGKFKGERFWWFFEVNQYH